MRAISLISFLVLAWFQFDVKAQSVLPIDSTTNMVVLNGVKPVDVRCKKKIMRGIESWVGEKQVYPPLVMTTVHKSKSRIVVKALTEVPSKKGLHPISFVMDISIGKKAFQYQLDNFYFEDIKLSLEEWLAKYSENGNDRNKETVAMISRELDSYIFLSFKTLQEKINDQ